MMNYIMLQNVHGKGGELEFMFIFVQRPFESQSFLIVYIACGHFENPSYLTQCFWRPIRTNKIYQRIHQTIYRGIVLFDKTSKKAHPDSIFKQPIFRPPFSDIQRSPLR